MSDSEDEASPVPIVECPICLQPYSHKDESLEPFVVEQCGHSFCQSCLTTMVAKNPYFFRCPIDRSVHGGQATYKRNFGLIRQLELGALHETKAAKGRARALEAGALEVAKLKGEVEDLRRDLQEAKKGEKETEGLKREAESLRRSLQQAQTRVAQLTESLKESAQKAKQDKSEVKRLKAQAESEAQRCLQAQRHAKNLREENDKLKEADSERTVLREENAKLKEALDKLSEKKKQLKEKMGELYLQKELLDRLMKAKDEACSKLERDLQEVVVARDAAQAAVEAFAQDSAQFPAQRLLATVTAMPGMSSASQPQPTSPAGSAEGHRPMPPPVPTKLVTPPADKMSTAAPTSKVPVSPKALATLESMGFKLEDSERALHIAGGNLQKALEALLRETASASSGSSGSGSGSASAQPSNVPMASGTVAKTGAAGSGTAPVIDATTVGASGDEATRGVASAPRGADGRRELPWTKVERSRRQR